MKSCCSFPHWGVGFCNAGHHQVRNNQLSSFQMSLIQLLCWFGLCCNLCLTCCFLKNKGYNLNKALVQTPCDRAGYRKVIQVPGCSCLLLERGWSPGQEFSSFLRLKGLSLLSTVTSSWGVVALSCSLAIGRVLPGHLFLPSNGCFQSLRICTHYNWSYFLTKYFLLRPFFKPWSQLLMEFKTGFCSMLQAEFT